MDHLCDTNILVRTAKRDHEQHDEVIASLSNLRKGGHELLIVPQCCYEFYVVATRPVEANGLGLTPDQAAIDIDELLTLFRLLRDERAIFETWGVLVSDHQVSGKPSHDARLVAAMLRHNVSHLLTCNEKDFQRFPEITVVPIGSS